MFLHTNLLSNHSSQVCHTCIIKISSELIAAYISLCLHKRDITANENQCRNTDGCTSQSTQFRNLRAPGLLCTEGVDPIGLSMDIVFSRIVIA